MECQLRDNALPHAGEKETQLLGEFGWENHDHLHYSLYLMPTDFYLFQK
jgi:hypothetical protein